VEPRALADFARSGAPSAARAARALQFLRWRGRPVDPAIALAALSPAEKQRFEKGREGFAVCAACHQSQGEGMAGLAPPLVGSPWATGGTGALIRIVLQGKTSGELTMPPLGALDDESIADILTFIRRSWGHESSVVTPAQVHAVRGKTGQREEPWSEAELASFE
jgi:mono/diheme cytochrome c family protein